ncbi:MAG: Crp/Fnr family transcriptional regulator [Propionibacteriaceae bacterium]|nr:Crp/Fnr family transcriptional regulator [Propionibacteriaceae bacterium]
MNTVVSVMALPVFRELSPEAASEFGSALVLRRMRRGEIIFGEHDPADGIYFVLSGKVKLCRGHGNPTAPDNRHSLLRLLGPASIFGELSALDGGRRSSSATAVTAVELARLPQDALRELMARHPSLTAAFIHQLVDRLRRADLVITGLSLNDVPGRVAAMLLHLADAVGEPRPEGILVAHELTQSELAAMVGATRETVNRTLTDLASRGIIDNGFRRLTIRDLARLRQRILR